LLQNRPFLHAYDHPDSYNKQQQLNSRTSDTNMLYKKEIKCLVHRRRNYASLVHRQNACSEFSARVLAQSSPAGRQGGRSVTEMKSALDNRFLQKSSSTTGLPRVAPRLPPLQPFTILESVSA
jgi:hypothetical protein